MQIRKISLNDRFEGPLAPPCRDLISGESRKSTTLDESTQFGCIGHVCFYLLCETCIRKTLKVCVNFAHMENKSFTLGTSWICDLFLEGAPKITLTFNIK